MIIYGLICLAFAAILFILSLKSVGRSNWGSKLLSGALLCESVDVLLYAVMACIFSENVVLILVSVSYAIADLMALFTLKFVMDFTGIKAKKVLDIIFHIIADVAIVGDIAMMLININLRHVITLKSTILFSTIHAFTYELSSYFLIHLAIRLLLIVSILAILIAKIVRTPSMYRGRYFILLSTIVLCTLLDCFCAARIGQSTVTPLWVFYSLGLFVVYWNAYDYTSSSMMNNIRKKLFENMDMPMVLFDNENILADSNGDMRILFPELESFDHKVTLMDFMQMAGFSELTEIDTNQAFEWKHKEFNGDEIAYQCNLNVIRSKRGEIVGRLILMKNLVLERDQVTRLFSRQSFIHKLRELIATDSYPIAVVVADANGIGLINDVFGWQKGNEVIRMLASIMKENLPETAFLARLDGANLAAVMTEVEQEYAIRLFDNIKEKFSEYGNTIMINTDMEFGVTIIRDRRKQPEDAIKEALESMKTKKMMNVSSHRSSVIDSLSQTLMESDYETKEHVERTRTMSIALGNVLHLSDADISKLAMLAVLHDIGKIAISHQILVKPSKLTDEEWEIMKSHTEKGYRIASASEELVPIADFILHHHERWDGTGYPSGLKGEEIPLLSRIITVVDSHDVMVHDRPYHKAMSAEAAKSELLRCSGTQFDPYIVDVFLKLLEQEEKETPHEQIFE